MGEAALARDRRKYWGNMNATGRNAISPGTPSAMLVHKDHLGDGHCIGIDHETSHHRQLRALFSRAGRTVQKARAAIRRRRNYDSHSTHRHLRLISFILAAGCSLERAGPGTPPVVRRRGNISACLRCALWQQQRLPSPQLEKHPLVGASVRLSPPAVLLTAGRLLARSPWSNQVPHSGSKLRRRYLRA